MKGVNRKADKNSFKMASFSNSMGTEGFFAFEAPTGVTFAESIQALFGEYESLQKEADLCADTEVFLRFHLSDITNQAKVLEAELRHRKRSSLISMVGQPPASGSKVALEAYHIKAEKAIRKKQVFENALMVSHGPYKSLWIRCRPQSIGPSYQQTQELFGQLSSILRPNGAKLENDVLRTWIYVRDVDNNYQGMVDARRELFEIVGLSKGTHYIASTGIEGCGEKVTALVLMDALAVVGLNPQQITYMNARDYLCPTYEYNVTFERATRVIYGDRSHYYISGTASIDREGNVLHVDNIEKQANRTLMNIQALLNNYGAELADLKILIVYLRDMSDTSVVQAFLKDNIPHGLPFIIVRGAVCRPLWLIEMEGIAVVHGSEPEFKPFC